MSRTAFIFGWIVVAILILGLYRAKYGANDARAEIVAIEADIMAAQSQKALLEAELSHMIRREWIEEYARRELGMGPPRADQYVDAESLFADAETPTASDAEVQP